MKQEVIQDFLNVPGIEGLALMDGHSRPFFCGLDQGLDFQQKKALVQGIQQVIDTTPVTHQCFQFKFGAHQVYVHKLAYGLILLVLTASALKYTTYNQYLTPLTVELQSDVSKAIANVRLVAGQTNFGVHYFSPTPAVPTVKRERATSTDTSSASATSASDLAAENDAPVQDTGTSESSATAASLTTSATSSVPQSDVPASSSPESQTTVSIEEFLHAINDLLQLSAEYLGKTMVNSYWKSSRPPIEWLKKFEVNRSGRLLLSPVEELTLPHVLSTEQQQWLREWVTTFIQKCARIIRDFDSVAQRMELDSRHKELLFPTP